MAAAASDVPRGDPFAQYALGNSPRGHDGEEGQGGQTDYHSRQLYEMAAAQDDANAQSHLDWLHHQGLGGPQDCVEARRLLGLAAAQGDANAQCELGCFHDRGTGGPKDYAEARRLYGLAAEQGHAGAQYMLGVLYALLLKMFL